MKVLETLGRHQSTQQKGIFQYRRTTAGVEIDAAVGLAASLQNQPIVTITHAQWMAILTAISNAGYATFRIQASSASGVPPHLNLDSIIQTAVPHLQGNTSLTSYVAAILEHEGTIELYGGPLGAGQGSPIVLRRDP